MLKVYECIFGADQVWLSPSKCSYKFTKLLTGLIDKPIAPQTCLLTGDIFRGVIIYHMQLSKEIKILKYQ